MQTGDARTAPALLALIALVGCVQGVAPTSPAPGTLAAPTAAASPTATPSSAGPAGAQPLGADSTATNTLGDTIRLSGGEFVGDQADLTVLEGFVSPPEPGSTAPRYAFLVEITGLDAEVFPYNLRDFSLFDDQAFEYQPLSSGGNEPRLEFGDLTPGRKVRGWLTFEGPAQSSFVELEYAPALALEPAHVRAIPPL